jgi:hypothetical protein
MSASLTRESDMVRGRRAARAGKMLDPTLRVSYKVVQAALMPRLQRVVGGRAA